MFIYAKQRRSGMLGGELSSAFEVRWWQEQVRMNSATPSKWKEWGKLKFQSDSSAVCGATTITYEHIPQSFSVENKIQKRSFLLLIARQQPVGSFVEWLREAERTRLNKSRSNRWLLGSQQRSWMDETKATQITCGTRCVWVGNLIRK